MEPLSPGQHAWVCRGMDTCDGGPLTGTSAPGWAAQSQRGRGTGPRQEGLLFLTPPKTSGPVRILHVNTARLQELTDS